ncbi:2-oxoglutarate dehydrogenase E1 component [Frateuria aurantia]|uniref:2-oxoglutarate dehydrogenase E1 component n=1 Tax=Frateuria aurantia (strain ATCC 33424 / DSM 6220 / KCTC 2777 / LMG 1558 / NBRC 3245 / NCIMB 13370) TaxID=767434 RepID=H8KY93_FRAAD|nr:2-oxoglutarate dehydrogenase E1 component [Frateuria aurantia]AFC86087.1 2-oxoglutarate dehydrogenase, E1 component [Frateuria aurantia DSM 6220]
MSTNLIREFAETSQLAGGNADYVEQLYETWLNDSAAVPDEWSQYFARFKGRESGDVPHSAAIARIESAQKQRVHAAAPADEAHARKQAAILRLITAYRSRGHLAARLDPLGLAEHLAAPDLEPSFHGLDNGDLDTVFDTGNYGGAQRLTLRELLVQLKRTYAGSIGAEFMHISRSHQREWIHERLEQAGGNAGLGADEKRRLLQGLTAADGLERYLHTKYVGQKRFSLEGGDSLIPLMDDIVRAAGDNGVKELVIGMAHRGRLNMLVNILGKPPRTLFNEFEGKFEHPDDPAHSGDVKYHMGFSADIATPKGGVHVALAFNPSHLEIVNPVVAGSVRARQTKRGDEACQHSMAVLIHGDAAFAGQGVNMELMNMSQARGFKIGGTLHVVVNNQVGFTTSNPLDSRSTQYCTDLAKMVNAPVFHVNGEDPEAVIEVTRLAYEFRKTFQKDVVIDLVCYRRHGHNEADEPMATQPVMYQIIRKRAPTRELYGAELVKEGVIADGDVQKLFEAYRDRLEAGEPMADLAHDLPKDIHFDWAPYINGRLSTKVDTRVPKQRLIELASQLTQLPADLVLQSRVAKIYDDRRKMASGEVAGDWGFAENLAYASLVDNDFNLRLVGQDCGRGTFFHRHAVLHDQKDGHTYTPLQDVRKDATVEVIDSLLSEEAVMAFEYGYSTTDPQTLNIWEGQFGDFANGAQVVIDQFISSGESKWGRLCGLALFLPHGYEGQGPEHSSARLERYLQLCALDNMTVCVPTTPAQDFHMIRRQMLRPARKPLIVMTPKSLLRHKLAVSTLDELADGEFQLVIGEHRPLPTEAVTRVVLCAGKVYYDLLDAAQHQELHNVALVRVEQLYPFPRAEVVAQLEKYPSARDVIWCQEEPMNQGAWYQIRHHLQACAGAGRRLSYAGRSSSAAPAAGHLNTHIAEQTALVEQALTASIDSSLEAE